MRLAFCLVIIVVAEAVGADDIIVGSQIRLNPGTRAYRADLEYSAVANELEVVALWRKFPPDDSNQEGQTFGRAFSNDGGTTWALDDVHGPGSAVRAREVDPFTAVDPRTGNLWVGGYAQGGGGTAKQVFVIRRQKGASNWETTVTVISNGNIGKNYFGV